VVHDAYFIPQVKLGTLRSLVGLCPESRLWTNLRKAGNLFLQGSNRSKPLSRRILSPFEDERTRCFGTQRRRKPETHEPISGTTFKGYYRIFRRGGLEFSSILPRRIPVVGVSLPPPCCEYVLRVLDRESREYHEWGPVGSTQTRLDIRKPLV
jgi:hypothetical protein